MPRLHHAGSDSPHQNEPFIVAVAALAVAVSMTAIVGWALYRRRQVEQEGWDPKVHVRQKLTRTVPSGWPGPLAR